MASRFLIRSVFSSKLCTADFNRASFISFCLLTFGIIVFSRTSWSLIRSVTRPFCTLWRYSLAIRSFILKLCGSGTLVLVSSLGANSVWRPARPNYWSGLDLPEAKDYCLLLKTSGSLHMFVIFPERTCLAKKPTPLLALNSVINYWRWSSIVS